ncbi:hypothetical protein Leryth_013095, partial [Lithospermum erythrorhizon]
EKDQNPSAEKFQNQSESFESDENLKSTQANDDSETGEQSKNGKDKGDATNSQQKTLKKPDKILPCPRCNSMDTKFCYYNNYNVNQPRHFCKNCQRYWTAGGTMRNVPVGAGRRKNKNSSSNCRHITISEALHAAHIDVPNGFHHPSIKPNGTVLSFGGSDSTLCESMSSVLNLAEKKAPNGYLNGYYKLGQVGDDCSSGSTVTTSSTMVDGGKQCPKPVMQNVNGFPSLPCLPTVAWPYPWNPAVPMPAICPSGYPIPFYPPPPYWNCSVPGPWRIPWMPSVSPTSNQKSLDSDPNSPTLGKRASDGDLLKAGTPEGKQSPEKKRCEGSVLVPKTLRIDDPDEAAKSSIWTTLGIKYDSINKGGMFNAFQSKADKHVIAPSSVLQANPAALSRSATFQEKV